MTVPTAITFSCNPTDFRGRFFAQTQWSGRVCLYDRRQLVEGELLEVNLLAGIIDVDADHITFRVVIKDNPLRDLSTLRREPRSCPAAPAQDSAAWASPLGSTLGAGPLGKIEIERGCD